MAVRPFFGKKSPEAESPLNPEPIKTSKAQHDIQDEGLDAAMNGSSSDAACLCSGILEKASAYMALAAQQHLRDVLGFLPAWHLRSNSISGIFQYANVMMGFLLFGRLRQHLNMLICSCRASSIQT